MPKSRIPILQRIALAVRKSAILDVYSIADAVAHEFPEVSREQLVQIVSEEVVCARANAYWGKKVAGGSPPNGVSGTILK